MNFVSYNQGHIPWLGIISVALLILAAGIFLVYKIKRETDFSWLVFYSGLAIAIGFITMGVLALAATFAASDNRPIFEHNLHTKYEFTSLITSYPISGGRFSPSVAGIEIHQAEPQEIVLNVDGDAKVYLLTLNLQTNEPTLHDTKTGQPTTTILK